jgi:hypothetical protein
MRKKANQSFYRKLWTRWNAFSHCRDSSTSVRVDTVFFFSFSIFFFRGNTKGNESYIFRGE